ncbi:MAG: hypothetical protein HXX14_15520 [Bacteroidetes bacterium]|nr:hypothetical protein [Bacteroidota bacterium]
MIGKYIWYLRLRDGLSLEAVSEKSGINTLIIKEFEGSNITHIPNADLAAIAKAFTFKNAIDYFRFLNLNGVERQFRLYALGLTKTGTVSIDGLFGKYRSCHEFWQWDTNQKYILFKEHSISREEFRDFILLRDAAACLEMDSAYFNRYYIDILSEEFTDAKFICLFRDPISWVKSQVNYYMDADREALQSTQIDNGFPFDMPRGEQVPRNKFLQNIDEYVEITFKSWAIAYRLILNQIRKLPDESYRFISTNQISQKLDLLANFAGVSQKNLVVGNAHSNKSVYQVDILKIVKSELIVQYFNKHCKDIMDEILEKI